MGGKLGKKIGIEIVRYRGPAGTSMYDFGESSPPPPGPSGTFQCELYLVIILTFN